MTRTVTTATGKKIILIGSSAAKKKDTRPAISTSTIKPRVERKANDENPR